MRSLRWIVAAGMQWVAFQNALDPPPRSADGTVFANGLDNIFAARRMKSTMRSEHGADEPLVATHDENQG